MFLKMKSFGLTRFPHYHVRFVGSEVISLERDLMINLMT